MKIQWHGAVFTVCWCTFTLFWSRKTSVIIKMFQLSFRVFVWPFIRRSLQFFGKSFLFLFLFFVKIQHYYSLLSLSVTSVAISYNRSLHMVKNVRLCKSYGGFHSSSIPKSVCLTGLYRNYKSRNKKDDLHL